MKLPIAIAAAALLQNGCASFSGLDGSSSYGCKAPEGVACESVSGTYANAVRNNLPSQRSSAMPRPGPATPPTAGQSSTAAAIAVPPSPPRDALAGSLPPTPVALRSAPRVLRLWFKPWEDADHDLYDQGYVYVVVDGGQWQIEHVRQQIRESYAAPKPPAPSGRVSAAGNPGGANAPPRSGTGIPTPPDASRAPEPALPSPVRPAPGADERDE